MALTYEKVPLYKVMKTWENNDPNLSKVYKLQSNYTRNKSWVEIHKDNGKYGIEYTIDKTIPEFNKGVETSVSHESHGVRKLEEGEEWPLGYSNIYITTISPPHNPLCTKQLNGDTSGL